MSKAFVHCLRCNETIEVPNEGEDMADTKRFIAEHESHGTVLGFETDSGTVEYTHQIGLPS